MPPEGRHGSDQVIHTSAPWGEVLPDAPDPSVVKKRSRYLLLLLAALALLATDLLVPFKTTPPAAAAFDLDDGWQGNPSYSIAYLGRNGPDNTDRYQATAGWGATFFAMSAETMPLMDTQQAVDLMIDSYRAAFPDRPPEDLQPGDSFPFEVPAGTPVCTQWRQSGSAREYRSLRGDSLHIHLDFRDPISYRLVRAESRNTAEIKINLLSYPLPAQLAAALYGAEEPGFTPDFFQVARARDILRNSREVVTIDTTRRFIDDLRDTRDGAERGGTTETGLDVYWFRSEEVAQPLFRIDDGIGDATDLSAVGSPIRVYYYKDGTVRTYQRAEDTTFLSGRQPRSDEWSKVYEEYGRTDPLPTRWEIGQPEQDATAEELGRLGVAVLRYQPREPPQGNFFTRLLDALIAMMKREQS